MWLLEISSSNKIRLREFNEKNTPPYAILSHRWLKYNEDEVSFHDMMEKSRGYQKKRGYQKIHDCCIESKERGIYHCWVDTCCIDRSSSAELSEAINCMFKWYKAAEICFAYLEDVYISSEDSWNQFEESSWFKRGWTLQELVAPKELVFFGKGWQRLGSKFELRRLVKTATGIEESVLRGASLKHYSVATRMSWAAGRETTRTEDIAYSLLGIFNVNMSLMYGEGEKAFIRLQEEIIKESADHSVFAWEPVDKTSTARRGIFARSPEEFAGSAAVTSLRDYFSESFSLTNQGLRMKMPFLPGGYDGKFVGLIGCQDDKGNILGVELTSHQGVLERNEQLERTPGKELQTALWAELSNPTLEWLTVCIAKNNPIPIFDDFNDDFRNSVGVACRSRSRVSTYSIRGHFPECRQVHQDRGTWFFNPLSSQHRHLAIVIDKQATLDTDALPILVVVGYRALANGRVDTNACWVHCTEANPGLLEPYAPFDTIAKRLWSRYSDRTPNSIPEFPKQGFETGDVVVHVSATPRTWLRVKYQHVVVIVSPRLQSG